MTALLPASTTAWVLTDGKAGDTAICFGVVEALGLDPVLHKIAPRPPWSWVTPFGPIDPKEAPQRRFSPIAPPYPDLVVASGRRAVPYVRRIRAETGGRTFTAFMKDPYTGIRTADLIWVPAHDTLAGPNVIKSPLTPHRVTAARLAAARAAPLEVLARLPAPRVAVLIGGNSVNHRFARSDIAELTSRLDRLAKDGASLMATLSRRTPPRLRRAIAAVIARHNGYLWDEKGDNPFIALLALADALVVTADSVGMVGEAAATGRPVLVFEPSGGHRKVTRYLDWLRSRGIVHNFTGHLAGSPYEPVDSTFAVASRIAEAFRRHCEAR
ncbi:MAG: mitochondrial fission ELM1 family protein [Hyphomicrobiales bacterium]|nr:mitochondrial fission ELM1 family protein [Hyphomicrobiales bacterium]